MVYGKPQTVALICRKGVNMFTQLLRMLSDDRITIESIDISVKGLFRTNLKVTYIDKETLIKHSLSLNYPDYSDASDARDRLEAVAVIY